MQPIIVAIFAAACLTAQPGAVSDANTPVTLSRASRVFVERTSPHYFVASDGSLWTREVEAMREDESNPERVTAFARNDAPLWYSPTLSAEHGLHVIAKSKENALEVISQLDHAAQVEAMRSQAVRSSDSVLIHSFKGETSRADGLIGRFVPDSGPVSTRTVLLTNVPSDVELVGHSFQNRYMLITRVDATSDSRHAVQRRSIDVYEVTAVATLRSPLEYGIRPVRDADELATLLHEAKLDDIPEWRLVRVKIKDGTTKNVKITVEGDGILRRRKVTETGGAPPVFEWQWSLNSKPLRWQTTDD